MFTFVVFDTVVPICPNESLLNTGSILATQDGSTIEIWRADRRGFVRGGRRRFGSVLDLQDHPARLHVRTRRAGGAERKGGRDLRDVDSQLQHGELVSELRGPLVGNDDCELSAGHVFILAIDPRWHQCDLVIAAL